jgi:nucleotide-binding universal stress UspA family protein
MRRPGRPARDGGFRPERTAVRENAAAPPSARGRAEAPGASRRIIIIVGVDDSACGLAALRWAVGQARSTLVAVRSWALGLPRHGGRRRRRPPHVRHPHIVLSFDGFERRDALARLVSTSFQIVAGGIPRDVTVTVRTPEGDPGAVLAGVSGADGDVLVVGRANGPSMRRLLHGSVSGYCREHARCPVVIVPADSACGRENAAREETP